MKVVNTGNTYQIYNDSMRTFDALPAQAYTVKFDKMSGFFLEKYSDIELNEKIYGPHENKVNKVMSAFKIFERNLGIILSGEKGIGKSLCAKMLAQKAIVEGYPVLIVNSYIPGIADFLTSIEQEVVVLLDEFDKTYSSNNKEDRNDPQVEMLTLFDGLSQGKKMFVVTCNSVNRLNDYLVNRPGRFHYHFRFDYPTHEEIREYLQDKIEPKYYGEIEKVVSFSRKVDLNYDCLRAIAFELSTGMTFESAIRDLNIVNVKWEEYSITAQFKDGSSGKTTDSMDMFADNDISIELKDHDGYYFDVEFNPCDGNYDHTKGGIVLIPEQVKIDWQTGYYGDDDKVQKRAKRELEYLLIRRKRAKGIHYAV